MSYTSCPQRRVAPRIMLLLAALAALFGPQPPSSRAASAIAGAVIAPANPTAPADGVTTIGLTASVHDAAGAPIPGVALRFATDHALSTITQPLTSTDVLGRVTGSIASRAQGAATVTLIDVATGSTLVSAQVTFLPAPDRATSSLQAGPATLDASGLISTVPVTVTVRDYQSLPLPARTVRLSTDNPGDRIVQPALTDSQGQAVGTVSFTGTATVVTAVDLGSGVTLGTLSLRGNASPAQASGIHAVLQPSAARMGNGSFRYVSADSDVITVRLTLFDGQGRPLAGKRVGLRASATFIDPGAAAVTDAAGVAAFTVQVRPLYRHFGISSGPVALSALDLTDARPLTATTQITVYNRVLVMVQGLGSSLSCTPTVCVDPLFPQLSTAALAPIGYNLNGDGLHRTEIEYSYRGGNMVRLPNGTWQWLINPYHPCDTAQPLDRSAQALRNLLQSYRARYPYTTFEILGHSLGGLVALYALAQDGGAFVRSLGPAAVDKIVTVDSPVNGIGDPRRLRLYADLLVGAVVLRSCSGQLFGSSMLATMFHVGKQAPGLQERWVASLRAAGTEVLTATNRDDRVVPESLAIIDDGRARHASDRIRYALGSVTETSGHGALIFRHRENGTPNPAWPGFISILQAYLRNPCAALAPYGASCPYPTINQGF